MEGESQNAQDARVEKLWKSLHGGTIEPLDLEGLRKGLKRINHPLANATGLLQEIFRTVDTSGNGMIEYEEFRYFVKHTEAELWGLFRSIDRDHNGELDKGELKEAFKKAGLHIDGSKLEQFFREVDSNNDGHISFDEWRDFLLFLPAHAPNLRAVMSYYSSTVFSNPEGDTNVSDEGARGLGYFLAGGTAGAVSRTATAPLDRLKVYLIAQTSTASDAAHALKSGSPVAAIRSAVRPLSNAIVALWQMGGVRSMFAGNGLNVLKVMPESAIKFGSYEASKRVFAQFEGHGDPKSIGPMSQFFAAGMGGVISQFAIYPLDTLKFRMQNETVKGGLHGNRLIVATAQKMWATNGIWTYYRGLGMGLIGMFPYSAIDLTTYEYLKKFVTDRNMRKTKCSEEDAAPGRMMTGGIGAISSSIGASSVYPLNLLRTRLQSQGTAIHPPTYTGWRDCLQKTVRVEGVRALFRGLTPNLLKVVPSMSISYMVYESSKNVLGLT